MGLWPVAGADLSWAIPLRAHSAARRGRTIVYGGLAGDRPVARVGPIVMAVGVFLDGVGILDRLYLDGGAGLRIGLAGGQFGVVRVDLARGLLVDRRVALTAGFHRRWPGGPRP